MKKLIFILFVGLITISFTSCEKSIPTYPFTINVISEDGTPIQNVYVQAGAPIPEAIPDFKGETDVNGKISWEYQYEAVLQVVATRGTPAAYIGCGYIKLEADKNVEITIVLQAYDPSQQGC